MFEELNSYLSKENLIFEIFKGFPQIFTIPLDISYYNKSTSIDQEINFTDVNLSLSDIISLNFLPKDLLNYISKNNFISSENSTVSKIFMDQVIKKENGGKESSLKFLGNTVQNKEKNIKVQNNLNIKEKEKEEDNIMKNPITKDLKNKNSLIMDKKNGFPSSQIQNYNINIYNPYINYVNICCPSSCSPFPSITNKDNYKNKTYKDSIFYLNEKEVIEGELPVNVFCENSKDNNNSVRNIPFNNSDNKVVNCLINNSHNLENNYQNYSQKELEQNLIFNSNNSSINEFMKMINENELSKNNLNKNGNQKMKKNKKKKKKKIDDEYTVEMFGRRGWICQGCNNFNYESRKNCNRCKIPKNPLKKSVIMDNKGNKISDSLLNANHKDDWNCYNCGNINYAFRLNCNRCQMKREDSFNEYNYNNSKIEN
jgi:hypothetical protein